MDDSFASCRPFVLLFWWPRRHGWQSGVEGTPTKTQTDFLLPESGTGKTAFVKCQVSRRILGPLHSRLSSVTLQIVGCRAFPNKLADSVPPGCAPGRPPGSPRLFPNDNSQSIGYYAAHNIRSDRSERFRAIPSDSERRAELNDLFITILVVSHALPKQSSIMSTRLNFLVILADGLVVGHTSDLAHL